MSARPVLSGGDEELSGLIGSFLSREEWARAALGLVGTEPVPARVVETEVLKETLPGLASVLVDAEGRRLHLVVGWRGISDTAGAGLRPAAVLGAGAYGSEEVIVYDALSDPELCLALLEAASGGELRARRARLVQSLVSHSALVFDEQLFMKCYRVIEPRPRPEIETMLALDRVGFNRLLAPLSHWSRSGADLGLVREFLPGAVEGKALALTSLRDLLARAGSNPAAPFEQVGLSGGDLSDEMRRLGETTAELHLALAEAFGSSAGPNGVAEIRLHGDYHLRRVMRFETGWLVAGFGDDPLIGESAGEASQGAARTAPCLEDVADLFASLAQVAAEAVSFQAPSTAGHASLLADGWVAHNRTAFLSGYLSSPGIASLVASPREEVEALVSAALPSRLGTA